MALIVSTNTYLTLVEADDYVVSNYLSTSTEFTTWDALSDGDKEILLKGATKRIDRQRIIGLKVYEAQSLSFPRTYTQPFTRSRLYSPSIVRYEGNWVVETSVANCVKEAQVEEAISIAVLGNDGDANLRIALQKQGVKSVKLGSMAETYIGVGQGFNTTRLESTTATELLQRYLTNSINIV